MEKQKEPMTKFGYAKLSNELNYLKTTERPYIVKEIEAALEHGDLKENAEYHAAKEKQRLIDSRMTELADILSRAQIVDPSTLAHAKISFGSTVVLQNITTNEEVTYTIVGGIESNPEMGLISFNSPLGRALIGKEVGDEVIVKAPKGDLTYEVISLKYN